MSEQNVLQMGLEICEERVELGDNDEPEDRCYILMDDHTYDASSWQHDSKKFSENDNSEVVNSMNTKYRSSYHCLLHDIYVRLKTGRHSPGLTENQKRSINKAKLNYDLKDDRLVYVSGSGRICEVLMTDEKKKNAFWTAHGDDHAGLNLTVDRILANYHWRGVRVSVKNMIQNCNVCKTKPAGCEGQHGNDTASTVRIGKRHRKCMSKSFQFSTTPSLEEIRSSLAGFARERNWDQYHTPRNLLMALVGEVGEVSEIFQWKGEVAVGLPDFTEVEKKNVSYELADVFLYLIRLAEKCNVDLPSAAMEKLEINRIKYPVDKVYGSSKKYTEYQ